ncbi:fatty acyl-CoA reductase 1-like [Lineus longissimus]|uniref:fatty acyl-CoA reductase 1-like n=1 Tax=Lineus longissimus TaxID=88925 RepID=UPI002B4D56AE
MAVFGEHYDLETSPKTVSTLSDVPPSIPEFYEGRTIFITGATGFMGKVLMEKLMRSCPKIKLIYVLIRPKKGQAPQERLSDILSSKLFDSIHETQPDFMERIIPINGDILSPELGISAEDEAKLISEVSIVFHSAATVKFDEALRFSLQMNVLGVKKLIELSKKMTNLDAFIHVSTAYANCDRQDVTECVYPPPVHPQKLLDAIEWMDDEMITKLTPKLIGSRPNTYTYTKALAEYLLVEESKSFSVAIVRPSIVGASWKEPMPGWVDNYNGPTGMLIAIGKGLLRVMKGNFYATSDMIPVDVAVNTMIAVGWHTGVEKPSNTMVYNCTTGQINRLTWGELERLSHEYLMKNPLEGAVRVPNPRFTRSSSWHNFKSVYEHQIPAYFLDTFRWLAGKKPIFVRLYDRLSKSVRSLDYFTSNEWKFHNDNMFMLQDKLNHDDQKLFDFDVKQIDWRQYIEHYCLGAKNHILKEDMTNMDKPRAEMKRLQTWTRIIKLVGLVILWRFLVSRVKIARSIWHFILQLVSKMISKFPGIAKS